MAQIVLINYRFIFLDFLNTNKRQRLYARSVHYRTDKDPENEDDQLPGAAHLGVRHCATRLPNATPFHLKLSPQFSTEHTQRKYYE
jgi:hypothetical protein